MELEVDNVTDNIIYFGKPVTGMSLDMSYVYRRMTWNPENIKPVESSGEPLKFAKTNESNSDAETERIGSS